MPTPQSEIETSQPQANAVEAATTGPRGATTTKAGGNARKGEIERILGLTVPVSVTLASRDMTIMSILGLKCGSILEFDTSCDEDLEINVAGHPVGLGQAVKVGENFGLRVTSIGSVRERIDAMGG